MKIVFAGGRGIPAAYGGFETAIEEIGARLAERGHEVVVYCRSGPSDEASQTYRGMTRVVVPAIRLPSLETLSHTFLALVHACWRRPDVLLIFNPGNGLLCLLPWLLRVPFAIHVDGLDWERAKWPTLGKRFIYFSAWFCTKIAPEIIADSRGIQDFYKGRWNRETYYASYGTSPVKSKRPELLKDYGLDPGEYFLIVARLEPENNTDFLIRAFKRVETDKKLAVVGGTSYRSAYYDELEALAEDGRVSLLGAIYDNDRLQELLSNCFAYLHGHSVGGTNPVLLQAMGCGAPVLYLDVPFNTEVAGDTGIPFPLDEDEAAGAMQGLLNDAAIAAQLPDRARKRVQEKYTWEQAADAYEALCRKLVGGSGHPPDLQ